MATPQTLPERLREDASLLRATGCDLLAAGVSEAADRIEALESALRDVLREADRDTKSFF